MRPDNDTIAAISTAPGMGAIGIVRLSGPHALAIAQQVIHKPLTPRIACYTEFYENESDVLDKGLCLYFPNPHSFTGEDIVEFQGHGGMIVLTQLLKRVVKLGARLATPGEFSLRAFLNNKIDLTQAEAIADLISAKTTQAARSAAQSLQGNFSKQLLALHEKIVHLRVYIEASLDFPEEEIDFLSGKEIWDKFTYIETTLDTILDKSHKGKVINQGLTLAIVGLPNAGKSSLLNCLAEEELAIVTDIPGTTRDLVKTHIHLDGIPLHLVDTAGIRTGAEVVEQQGITRALAEIEKCDVILWVQDALHNKQETNLDITKDNQILLDKLKPYQEKIIQVISKIDLNSDWQKTPNQNPERVGVSIRTGVGIDNLKQTIKNKVGLTQDEDVFLARTRHIEALTQAKKELEQARVEWQARRHECLAECLKRSHHLLGEIVGVFSTEDLLGKIFSSFCIGK
jgi:tRNA modification GTPase